MGYFLVSVLSLVFVAAATADEPLRFYYGLNLNGPALAIDGNSWDGQDSKRYQAKANAFENQNVELLPSTDAERARMIRSSRWGDVDIAVTDVPDGQYSLYIYIWEDNQPEKYGIAVNGREVVGRYESGPAGRWEKLGPWHVRPQDNTIRLTTRGGAANISGIELWQGKAVAGSDPATQPSPEALAFFESRIRPLLIDHCYECHSAEADAVEAGLWLDSRAGVHRGGDSGPAVVSGDPANSLLMQAVRYQNDELQMPPDGKLTPAQIADLENWIRMGAPDPRTESALAVQKKQQALEEARKHWSYQPLRRPAVPMVQDAEWPQNEIDHFIQARLEQHGLTPVAVADRRVLIRRATYDLIGLPATPEDIEAFVNDARPLDKAFADVVERLLASPQYGERWGRHWMDLVRYADTAGDNSDYPIPQLYLYRNYIIGAFNRDLPYDQFIRQQIAGDLLPADSAAQRNEQIIATGYIAISRRFGSIVNDYPQHLTIEDTLDNLSRTVLGLTVTCARCHDHKFDAISQEDYYGLYGIFAGTRYPFPGIELDKKPRDFVALQDVDASGTSMAYAVADGEAGDARLHRRGDPKDPGETVPRKFLDVLGGHALPEEALSTSGRLQLAGWLTDPANPLTARVMANRIWQFHFGRGLVQTPSDFGTRGLPPTHPELLDYLADRFVAEGWSIKQMHRLIMASRTYQLASQDDPKNIAVDPDNQLHWKFDRRRLDAESLRDALLALSGNLDASVMDQSHPFPPVDKWEFTQHHPFRDTYPSNRRSVYLMTTRLNALPYFTTFDGPDRNATTPLRDDSVTTIQALFLMNDEFFHEQATDFGNRVFEARSDDASRLELAFELGLGRPPTDAEQAAAETFVADLCQLIEGSVADETERHRVAWQSYARVLLRTNEFLYVD